MYPYSVTVNHCKYHFGLVGSCLTWSNGRPYCPVCDDDAFERVAHNEAHALGCSGCGTTWPIIENVQENDP